MTFHKETLTEDRDMFNLAQTLYSEYIHICVCIFIHIMSRITIFNLCPFCQLKVNLIQMKTVSNEDGTTIQTYFTSG